MSEFHPNRQGAVKTKLGLTRRRLLESWPLLGWVGIVGAIIVITFIVYAAQNSGFDTYDDYSY